MGHLLGVQAQAPHPPYVGLWSRLQASPRELAGLSRPDVVRTSLLRGTIHLVTAATA